MTSDPNVSPNRNEEPDTEGRTVPPYDGRQEGGEVDTGDTTRQGARTGGATGPVADAEPKADDPADTERGEHASPADEQPAEEVTATDRDDDMTGPAHEPGTGRGEDRS